MESITSIWHILSNFIYIVLGCRFVISVSSRISMGSATQEECPYLQSERFSGLCVANKSALFIEVTKVDCADRQDYRVEESDTYFI